ncbi:alpha/beta fold hydrolase [Pseudoalteromonas sp. S2755]|uniref:thioesterase II family protein n=1 Tax=Pseudoalteromonas sp. S2755 TaxID=2066523 RepID=UPI00110B5E8E|nr:alpha/beta fold hydrolase [Pseudoalteromonas sp. S2755]TMN45138.1 thioesterase [Pseudoalteromonas sp. S2755]
MNKWYVTPSPRPKATVKLICFPYAGGSAGSFSSWPKLLPDHVEVHIIQLPGRGAHFDKAPIDNMDELIDGLVPNISHLLSNDYVIFGHSLGSRIGFEVARRALALGLRAPQHFFASGSAGPQRQCFKDRVYEYADPEFMLELEKMNGTPKEILEHRELMELYLPMLRADFKVAGQYSYQGKTTIPSAVTVFYGKKDAVSTKEIEMWADLFLEFDCHAFEGGHFFIDTHSTQVIDKLNTFFEETFLSREVEAAC